MPYLQSLEGALKGFKKIPFSNMIKRIIVFKEGITNGPGSA